MSSSRAPWQLALLSQVGAVLRRQRHPRLTPVSHRSLESTLSHRKIFSSRRPARSWSLSAITTSSSSVLRTGSPQSLRPRANQHLHNHFSTRHHFCEPLPRSGVLMARRPDGPPQLHSRGPPAPQKIRQRIHNLRGSTKVTQSWITYALLGSSHDVTLFADLRSTGSGPRARQLWGPCDSWGPNQG